MLALEYARYRTLSTGRECRVDVDPSAHTVSLHEFVVSEAVLTGATVLAEAIVEGGTFEHAMHPIHRGLPYIVQLADDDPFSQVQIAEVDFDGSTSVTFAAVGTPSTHGHLVLSHGERKRLIEVRAVSGRVEVTE